jgi:hypothetical protein
MRETWEGSLLDELCYPASSPSAAVNSARDQMGVPASNRCARRHFWQLVNHRADDTASLRDAIASGRGRFWPRLGWLRDRAGDDIGISDRARHDRQATAGARLGTPDVVVQVRCMTDGGMNAADNPAWLCCGLR